MDKQNQRSYVCSQRFEVRTLKAIEKIAEDEGTTRSDVINRLLREALEHRYTWKKIDLILAILEGKEGE